MCSVRVRAVDRVFQGILIESFQRCTVGGDNEHYLTTVSTPFRRYTNQKKLSGKNAHRYLCVYSRTSVKTTA